MPAALDEMALLRQRVLESLMKKSSVDPITNLDEDSEMEEGEVQESVDRTIAAKSLTFGASPFQRTQIAIPLDQPSIGHGIPGLNGTRLNGINGEKEVPQIDMRLIDMPDDPPVEIPYLTGEPIASKDRVPPWRQSGSRSGSMNLVSKRQSSSDFPQSDRPVKRLGTNQHPSLVIDFGSDDEEEVSHNAMSQAPHANLVVHKTTNTVQKKQGAEKLRRVEAEIAQAMAVITKAQEMQNAKKRTIVSKVNEGDPRSAASTPQPMSCIDTIPNPTAETSEQLLRNKPLLDIRKSQVSKLQSLQAELALHDADIATKRRALIELRMAEAETIREKTIEDIREQACLDTINLIDEEIARLRIQLTENKILLPEIQSSRAALESAMRQSSTAQKDLALSIQGIEEEKKLMYPKISALRNTLAKTQSTAGLPLRSDVLHSPITTKEVSAPNDSNLASVGTIVAMPLPVDTTPFKITPTTQRDLAANALSLPAIQHDPKGNKRYKAEPISIGTCQSPESSEEGEIIENPAVVVVKSAEEPSHMSKVTGFPGLPAHTPQGPRGREKMPRSLSSRNDALHTERSSTSSNPILPVSAAPNGLQPLVKPGREQVVSTCSPEHTALQPIDPARKSISDKTVSLERCPADTGPGGTSHGHANSLSLLSNTRQHSHGALTAAAHDTTKILQKATSTIATDTSRDTVYRSPLLVFRNFKYHLEYLRTVGLGFRSPTYFHKAKQDTLLCKFETQRGQCKDSACKDQHFADILMTDDQILIELSSATIGHTHTEKTSYREGLRAVLQKMKAEKVDDFETVSLRMVEYRRSRQAHNNQSITSFF